MATEASLQLNLGTGGRLEVQVPKYRISVPSLLKGEQLRQTELFVVR